MAHGSGTVKKRPGARAGVKEAMKTSVFRGAAARAGKALAGLLGAASLVFAPAGSAAKPLPAQAPPGAAAAPAPAARPAPRPALWLLSDGDTRIYLLGTTHVLPPNFQWRSEAVNRAIAEADELVMETPDGPGDDQAQDEALFRTMLLPKPVPILSRVSEERREPLRRMIAAGPVPAEMYDMMETWAAAMLLGFAPILEAWGRESKGASPRGVEDDLTAEFRRLGRPISGVETGAQQLSFLRSVSQETQRLLLESAIDSSIAGEDEVAAAEASDAAWVSGDLDPIARDMRSMPPELYDVLVTRRNRAWTEWLVRRLQRPGTVLFAVGAGHLAGPDSVQAMLGARGLRVTRIN